MFFVTNVLDISPGLPTQKVSMRKKPVNNSMRIDLSDKSKEEIAEYLQAILAIRHTLHKQGFKLQVKKRPSVPSFKISRI